MDVSVISWPPEVDYLILSSSNPAILAQSQRIADWKLHMGLKTRVVTVDSSGSEFDEGYTDIYYACLDGEWDSGNDGIYGNDNSTTESGLQCTYDTNGVYTCQPSDTDTVVENDLWSDVYIGRLPASTGEEAKIMVDKILAYRSTPRSKGAGESIGFSGGRIMDAAYFDNVRNEIMDDGTYCWHYQILPQFREESSPFRNAPVDEMYEDRVLSDESVLDDSLRILVPQMREFERFACTQTRSTALPPQKESIVAIFADYVASPCSRSLQLPAPRACTWEFGVRPAYWNPLKTNVALHGCALGVSDEGLIEYTPTLTFEQAETKCGIQIEILPEVGLWRRQEVFIPWAAWGGFAGSVTSAPARWERLGFCFGYDDMDSGQSKPTSMRRRRADPYPNTVNQPILGVTGVMSLDCWGEISFGDSPVVVALLVRGRYLGTDHPSPRRTHERPVAVHFAIGAKG